MSGEPDFEMVPVGQADYAGAIDLVQHTMRPASDVLLSQALAVLEVSTVRGRESKESAALGNSVYLSILAKYPHDVALTAIYDLTMTAKFAPALSEIIDKCEQLVSKRRALLHALIWSQKRFSA
jgi:hypothetical protein